MTAHSAQRLSGNAGLVVESSLQRFLYGN